MVGRAVWVCAEIREPGVNIEHSRLQEAKKGEQTWLCPVFAGRVLVVKPFLPTPKSSRV